MGVYNAAKAGVIHLTRTAAMANAAYGMRANCGCTGGINPVPHKALARMHAEEFRPRLAVALLFLASAAAAFITGVSLGATCGVMAPTGLPELTRFHASVGSTPEAFANPDGASLPNGIQWAT